MLGGGGHLVVGASVGALHGAVVAAEPTPESVVQLEEAWTRLAKLGVLGSSWRS